jgi:hypothetical protein
MGFPNTHTVIMQQLMRTVGMLEAEWNQGLGGSVSTGAKESESSTGHIWATGFHHVTTHTHLVRILKLMNRLFL